MEKVTEMPERLLEVEGLEVSFATEDGLVRAVDGVSFTLDRGEVVAIVGESGSGKSVTVMSLMGLTRSPNSRFGGSARLNGSDLITASEAELEDVRGREIAMIFQDPISSRARGNGRGPIRTSSPAGCVSG
jgi:ABC-type glutathione transport system ATPase component